MKNDLAALTEALHDKDADVRRVAAIALGKLGDPSAISALTEALHDEKAWVRETAAIALRKLQGNGTKEASHD